MKMEWICLHAMNKSGVMVDELSGIVYDTAMSMSFPQIVIDTNVIVSALRSQFGASYKLLMLLESNKFEIHLSVPLVLEYEEAAKRQTGKDLRASDVDDILDYLCMIAVLHEIYFLWRPFLSDPQDDMVLELAVAAQCKIIVTYNKQDFRGVEQFGIRVLTPREFLQEIGALS